MSKQVNRSGKCLFVLDTNVLLHDPTALFQFHEHDIFLPMVVVEELDGKKKGLSEVAHNARQASRFIDELTHDKTHDEIMLGLLLRPSSLSESTLKPGGRIYFQTRDMVTYLPDTLPVSKADNTILATALGLQNERSDTDVILVSKDVNLRIKAAIIGLHAEDYFNDQVLDDIDLLYTGIYKLPDDFWVTHSGDMQSWREKEKVFYKVSSPLVKDWFPNQFLSGNHDYPTESIVREVNHEEGYAVFEILTNYMHQQHAVWGVNARNAEQNYAFHLLMDPEVDFVSLVGPAGTGKTLLTVAAALKQTLEDNIYREVIMTRVTVPVGEDIGFLPGTEEEKMAPWMGALTDNLEVLLEPNKEGGEWGRNATKDVVMSRVKMRSLNFMRGRTFFKRFIILDEAQNLTNKQMKTLTTRAGPGSKVIALGNLAQIDTPYLTATTSGLTNVVDRFRSWEHSGHVMLRQGERSRLAGFAEKHL